LRCISKETLKIEREIGEKDERCESQMSEIMSKLEECDDL